MPSQEWAGLVFDIDHLLDPLGTGRCRTAIALAIKAIARDLRLSRKVVRKAIRTPEACFAYQRTVQPLPRLGPFQKRLEALLTENEGRPRRERLRMTRIHDLLRREGPSTSSGEPSTAPTMRSAAMPRAG